MIWRVTQGVMAALLVLGAVVQHNDPDPAIWIAVYLCAAILSLMGALGRPLIPMMGASALLAAVWGAWLATGVIGQQPIFDEEGREMMGLGIIALWLGGSALWAWRQSRGRALPDGESS